jgi:hypothetical protein
MIGLLGRLEHYRQSLRRWLVSVSWTSGNEYHAVLIFLVLLLAVPVIGIDLASGPAGVAFLGSEAGLFFCLFFLALYFILTVFLMPLGCFML